MSLTSPSREASDEVVVLLIIGVVMGGSVLAWMSGLWIHITAFLTAHAVLVPATHSPLLAVPGAEGAGLDQPRLIVAGGLTLIVSALTAAHMSRLRHSVKRST